MDRQLVMAAGLIFPDWLVIFQWFAALGFMLVLAWEPWRAMHSLALAELSPGPAGRIKSPGFVFVLPLLVGAAPVVARFLPGEPALDLWRQPHLLLPGVAIVLALIVAVQAALCRHVLVTARRRKMARETGA